MTKQTEELNRQAEEHHLAAAKPTEEETRKHQEQLLGAASELLNAAKIALMLLHNSGFTGQTKAVIALKAAIAKAEGK